MIERIVCMICLLVGYGFGLFQTAYIYGRIKHMDVRTKGSGNLGTTNMFRVIGIKAGILTFVGDIGKVLAALACVYCIVILWLQMDIDRCALFLYTGFGAVLGHDFPCYLNFKGGKGVAASVAVLVALWDWKLVAVGVVVFFAIAFSTQYISLASLCMMLSVYISFILFTQLGITVVDSRWLPDCYIIIALMVILVFFTHRKNISRLLRGTENKFRFMSEKEIKDSENRQS